MAARLAGVSIVLGRTELTVIPWGCSSRARAWVNAMTPALAVVYAMTPGPGGTAAREPIVTTRPRPAFTMWGTTARAATNVAVRFMASIPSHVARSVSIR